MYNLHADPLNHRMAKIDADESSICKLIQPIIARIIIYLFCVIGFVQIKIHVRQNIIPFHFFQISSPRISSLNSFQAFLSNRVVSKILFDRNLSGYLVNPLVFLFHSLSRFQRNKNGGLRSVVSSRNWTANDVSMYRCAAMKSEIVRRSSRFNLRSSSNELSRSGIPDRIEILDQPRSSKVFVDLSTRRSILAHPLPSCKRADDVNYTTLESVIGREEYFSSTITNEIRETHPFSISAGLKQPVPPRFQYFSHFLSFFQQSLIITRVINIKTKIWIGMIRHFFKYIF